MFKLEGVAEAHLGCQKGCRGELKAYTKKGAAKYGHPLGVGTTGWEGVDTIDMYVVGAVAVTREGVRLGKGLGYAEMEWAILYKMGKARNSCFQALIFTSSL